MSYTTVQTRRQDILEREMKWREQQKAPRESLRTSWQPYLQILSENQEENTWSIYINE